MQIFCVKSFLYVDFLRVAPLSFSARALCIFTPYSRVTTCRGLLRRISFRRSVCVQNDVFTLLCCYLSFRVVVKQAGTELLVQHVSRDTVERVLEE